MTIYGIAIHGLATCAWLFPVFWFFGFCVLRDYPPKSHMAIDVLGGLFLAIIADLTLACFINAVRSIW